MSGGRDSQLGFEPLHEAHAIEQAAFIIQFNGGIDAGHLRALDRIMVDKFGGLLPKRTELQMLTFAFTTLPMAPPPPGGIAGFSYQKNAPDGKTTENELRMESGMLLYRTLAYRRWADFWGQAQKIVAELLPKYSENLSLASVGLTYVDRFLWSGAVEKCDWNRLLRPDSPFVSPHVAKALELWHNHTGAFVKADARTKRLLNVNLDALDDQRPEGPRRLVNIGTVITDMLNQPNFERTEAQGSVVVEVCSTHMEEMHRLSKDVLGSIIQDDMAQRIQLHAE